MSETIHLQSVGGDSSPGNGAEWFHKELGFIKAEVIEGVSGQLASIYFLEQDWHKYEIHPKSKNGEVSEDYITGVLNDPNEAVRMVSAAVKARRKLEAFENVDPFQLLSTLELARLEFSPKLQ